jgi:hypothetical protein
MYRKTPPIEDLPLFTAHHDGETYEPERDKARLNAQQQRVFDVVKDGEWRTLSEIAHATGDPEASVSARLRDFRKPKFGGYNIDRRYMGDGLYEYRMTHTNTGRNP